MPLHQQHNSPPALSLLLAIASCSRHAAQTKAIQIVTKIVFVIVVEEITRRRYASGNLQEQQQPWVSTAAPPSPGSSSTQTFEFKI
jgi:hypothetical protein